MNKDTRNIKDCIINYMEKVLQLSPDRIYSIDEAAHGKGGYNFIVYDNTLGIGVLNPEHLAGLYVTNVPSYILFYTHHSTFSLIGSSDDLYDILFNIKYLVSNINNIKLIPQVYPTWHDVQKD